MTSHQGVLTLLLSVVLLILPSLTYGETFYVRPTSANTSCLTQPCHTLSEYAQGLGQYFNGSNPTLQFLPGNHTLNVNLNITNIQQLEILGNSSAVVPTRVVCSSRVGFAFVDIPKLRIDGLTFFSCAGSRVIQFSNFDISFTAYFGLYLQSVQITEIGDCTFQDSYGSAIGVVDSHVVLRGNNSFLNNCRLYSNYVTESMCYGGGVFASRSNLSFTGSNSFFSNSAESGGGIHAETNSNVSICGNITFVGNGAGDEGGGLSAGTDSNVSISANTTFIGNSANHGGGISVGSNSNVDIGGSTTFTDNSARIGGGGICTGYNSNLHISGNTTFIGNSAMIDGGGVYAELDSNIVTISGMTTFISNSAGDNGGGVCAQPNSNMTITGNTNFISNSATGDGGGVYAGSDGNMNISGNTTFVANSAGKGGGVYSCSSMNISGNTTFISNSAKGDGGGVYAEFGTNISGNTTFINNSACRHGGGVYVESDSNMTMSENTTFIGNSATDDGGGAHLGSNSNANITGNTTFIGNSASDGGAVYAGPNSSVNINDNAIFSGNSATFGGGIHLQSNTKGNINGSIIFVGNSAHEDRSEAIHNRNVVISGNSASANSATFGGGVYVGSNSSVCIGGNIIFSCNSASWEGGGLYAASDSHVNVHGNTIFNGNSARNGGCIFVATFLNLWGNSTFTNCSASVGGAIYAKGTQVWFNGTNIFSANRAAHFGGGLYAPKSSLSLLGDYTFTANCVRSRGGGIYAQQTKINFKGTGLFSGNVAQLDGGGIYADGSNLSFSGHITIRNNTAQLGGGVYSDNNTLYIGGHNTVKKNIATYYGGGIYTRRSSLIIGGKNMFISNSAREGGGLYAIANSILNVNGVNVLIGNRAYISGGGIWLDSSNLTLNGSNHFVECAASYEGGAIFTYAATVSLPGNNTFEFNSATTGGGIHARWSNVRVANSCGFKFNMAVFGGGIFSDNSSFEFNDSVTLKGNQANHTGGGIYAARSVLHILGSSFITANNAARDGGGIYTRDDCVVILLGLDIYQDNSAGEMGGGISAFRSTFSFDGQTTFNSNHAVEGGGFYAVKSTVNVPGKAFLVANSASNHGGGITIIHGTLHLNGSTTFKNNSAASGGGMYIGESTVDIDGSNFIKNMAISGGGIHAQESVVKFNGNNMFVANSAEIKGAAIHLSFSTLIFQGSSSFENNLADYGGGIHSESSNLTFIHLESSYHAKVSPSCINCKSVCNDPSTVAKNIFFNNTALRGGAQYFDLYSNFSLYQTACVYFQDNHATEFGGAIYAVDVSGPGQLFSQQHMPFRSVCFCHILGKEKPLGLNTTPLVFVNNTAKMRGRVLYGGLLEKCKFTLDRNISGLEFFNMSILRVRTKDDVGYSISSDPSQLCFCSMNEMNCREASQSRSIYPGQQVMVSVVAIDQSGSAISTLIHTNIRSGYSLNLSETVSYETGENCTSRNYSVTPKNLFNQLELFPSNRSGNTIHLTLNITSESCPIGFEQSNFTGECICDHRLWQYTNSCDIDREAIVRNATRTFWLGVSYNNGTFEGFIHHAYCPLSYCTSESKYINLNNPDKQCNYNRSGLLCGKCNEGLSLVLGSSQCKQCSNNYLALLVPFALAGVLLVILLLLLHLTVAAGTLHGLIFYANIVEANHHIFFPHTSNNPASIFIAWLNLDLGIQTCFYNGMDAYAKTWLEFVFPVYIWVMVGFLVYISHHSVTVTKLLGSSPVPVLATLFLLSYAKVLRTIIAALSLTILHYPHEKVVVWNHDANVSLAKYIPLVLVAVLFFLFLFLPYTLLLLLSQWLKHNFCLLHWVKNPKVKAILDAYHAPYKPGYRFWTGLLLLLRCALLLVFAFNVSGDNSINLLVISSTAFGIILGFALSGLAYKSWYLNALELSFILNLGMLAVATYHVNQSGGSQAAVAYTSVGIVFLNFVGIVTYHIYIRIKSKVQYISRGNQLRHGNKCNRKGTSRSLCHQPRATPAVTHTEVNLHELRSPLDLLSYHQMD